MRATRLILAALTCAALVGPTGAFAQSTAPATAAPAAPAPAPTPAPTMAPPAMKGMKMPATASMPTATMVNINTASAAELHKLPQIGRARSAKIIKNRPYKSTDELLSKKVLPKGVYEKIKSMVTTG